MHDSSFNHRFRVVGSNTIPEASGDRYYAGDLARDHRYLQGLSGWAVMTLVAGGNTALLSGGTVSEGSTKALIDVSAAIGLCKFAVDVADHDTWALPQPVTSQDIYVAVRSAGDTDVAIGGTLDGMATNYVKLRFLEDDGDAIRVRQYESGDFWFVKVDSYEIVADEVAPTDYDVLLATYVGDGSTTLTITQVDPAIGPAATAYAIARRDSAGRMKAAAPSVAGDVAILSTVTDHAALTSPHGAVSAATADKIMLRDGSGRSKAAEPAAADDVAVLKTVTDHAAVTAAHGAVSAATADKIVLRDGSGRAAFADPAAAGDAATKNYVDGKVGNIKVITNVVNLGTIDTDYEMPALNVGEVCFLRTYGTNSSGSAIHISLPSTGTYRMISHHWSSVDNNFNDESRLSVPAAVDGANHYSLSDASTNFTTESVYLRVS